MPRGTTDFKKNNAEMGVDTIVKLTEKPQKFIFEGIGKAKETKFGPVTPIYILDVDTREALTLQAYSQLYKIIADLAPDRWDVLEMALTIELVKDEKGSPVYNKNGKEKKNYIYTISKAGKVEPEIDIDDIDLPF